MQPSSVAGDDSEERVSYDVDIFLDSSTVLKNLAPNINSVTKSLCDTWRWPGKYLKLTLRDVGEIDFLNAPSYIDNPTYQLKFGDRSIAAERSAEIATKKLVYRASTYTARDTFDRTPPVRTAFRVATLPAMVC